MNFLAHAYLSFGEPGILAGNMLSDFIKGKKQYEYPLHIRQGIMLHRAIDEFTDAHAATTRAKEFFKPVYGLYAAPFTDIVYDHFLARDKGAFAPVELSTFTATTYKQLKEFEDIFPDKFRIFFHYMQKENWLYNYQFLEGIHSSFNGLVRRAKYMNDAGPAYSILLENYEALEACYRDIFPSVRSFAYEFLYSTIRNLA